VPQNVPTRVRIALESRGDSNSIEVRAERRETSRGAQQFRIDHERITQRLCDMNLDEMEIAFVEEYRPWRDPTKSGASWA
jgi:hypothetical protein